MTTATEWKTMLQQARGRTLTGYATSAVGGRLQGLTLVFGEYDVVIDLSAHTYDDDAFIEVGITEKGNA